MVCVTCCCADVRWLFDCAGRVCDLHGYFLVFGLPGFVVCLGYCGCFGFGVWSLVNCCLFVGCCDCWIVGLIVYFMFVYVWVLGSCCGLAFGSCMFGSSLLVELVCFWVGLRLFVLCWYLVWFGVVVSCSRVLCVLGGMAFLALFEVCLVLDFVVLCIV